MSNFEERADGLMDIEATCIDNKEPFVITANEQRFYSGKGLSLPKRCKKCRDAKRERNAAQDAKAVL